MFQYESGGTKKMNTNHRHRWLFVLTIILVFCLFVTAFVLSYDALFKLARDNGISPCLAFLWPLGLDAFMAASSLAVVWASLNQARAGWYRAMVIGAVGMSIAGNVLHAESIIVAQVIAALPPTVAFLSFETLMAMTRHETARAGIRSSIGNLEEQLGTLRDDVATEKGTLTDARAKKNATLKRHRELSDQCQELEKHIEELEQYGGDTKAIRQA